MADAKKTTGLSLKPIVVLVVICIVVSSMLAVVNTLTAPVIAAAKAEALAASLRAVMPGAAGFEELEPNDPDVLHIYREQSGLGYVIVTIGHGYHGDVTVTTGINPEGVITGVRVDASGESAGVGTRVQESTYTDRFTGLSGSASSVDTLSGATISSRAVKEAVDLALAVFAQQEG